MPDEVHAKYDSHPHALLRVPVQDDVLAEFLPAPFVKLWHESQELRRRADAAFEVARGAARFLPHAEKRDSEALAAAIRAGDPDPGPANLNAARAEADESRRQATGLDEAAFAAASEFYSACQALDRRPICEALEVAAAAAADRARDLRAQAEHERGEALTLRTLSQWADSVPGRIVSPLTGGDSQDRARGRVAWLEDLDAMFSPRPVCLEPVADPEADAAA